MYHEHLAYSWQRMPAQLEQFKSQLDYTIRWTTTLGDILLSISIMSE